MDKQTIVNYWFDSAQQNRQDAISMYDSKHYDWSLFVWHLTLEKLLKGILASKDLEQPKIHNLPKLADMASIQLTLERRQDLQEITTFNLEARYADYKYQFHKRVNQKYAKIWVTKCEEIYQWLILQK